MQYVRSSMLDYTIPTELLKPVDVSERENLFFRILTHKQAREDELAEQQKNFLFNKFRDWYENKQIGEIVANNMTPEGNINWGNAAQQIWRINPQKALELDKYLREAALEEMEFKLKEEKAKRAEETPDLQTQKLLSEIELAKKRKEKVDREIDALNQQIKKRAGEMERKKQETEDAYKLDKITTDTALAKIRYLRNMLSEKKMKTGLGAQIISTLFPASTAGDIKGAIDWLVNNLTLEKIISFKKSGGTLGALSEREAKMVSSAVTTLNISGSVDRNLKALDDIEKILVAKRNSIVKANKINFNTGKYIVEEMTEEDFDEE